MCDKYLEERTYIARFKVVDERWLLIGVDDGWDYGCVIR
jgi:hypothetical protein